MSLGSVTVKVLVIVVVTSNILMFDARNPVRRSSLSTMW